MPVKHQREILYVDDDASTTHLIERLLQSHGYRVTSVNDPMCTIRELAHRQWCVVLLDIAMPEINGLDLLKMIKAYNGGTQVIIFTAHKTASLVLQSFQLGAEACLDKSGDVSMLLEALEDVFRKIDRWSRCLQDLEEPLK